MMKGGPGTADSTRIAYTRVLMRNLLVRAYGMKSDQISGPPWLDEVIGDKAVFVTINATMAPGITRSSFSLCCKISSSSAFIWRSTLDKGFSRLRVGRCSGRSEIEGSGRAEDVPRRTRFAWPGNAARCEWFPRSAARFACQFEIPGWVCGDVPLQQQDIDDSVRRKDGRHG